ncbi:RDD family protein [Rubripirellula tenax]|uniref:RDD family protein n=2 Tax=Rubripirellula tenax TaxID=2528015 RepID=A0A5C6FJ55_9BACT|nr:RDD family protein [Rubripirellula tenax]
MPVYLPTRSMPDCLPREPAPAKLWRRGRHCPALDQRPSINADNQHMHRSGGGHVSLESRQSPPPGDVRRYATDTRTNRNVNLGDNSLGDANYYEPTDYAGFGKRLIAMLIDSIVIVVIGIILWMPFLVLILSEVIQSDPSGIFLLAFLAAIWVYLAPVKRSNFGTIGYRLLGIKLVSAKGGRPSLISMTIRMMMWMFGPFNLVLDLLWLGADTESQSLRDCYLGTYLINRNATPIGSGPVHLTRYNAMGFALAYPRVCRPKQVA